MLKIQRIDGALADKFVGSSIIRKMNLGTSVIRLNTQINDSSIHFMFSRQPSLKPVSDRFNNAIHTLNENGDIQTVLNKYLH